MQSVFAQKLAEWYETVIQYFEFEVLTELILFVFFLAGSYLDGWMQKLRVVLDGHVPYSVNQIFVVVPHAEAVVAAHHVLTSAFAQTIAGFFRVLIFLVLIFCIRYRLAGIDH